MPKPRGHAHRSRNLSLEELSKYFHLPINDVASKLGLCVTVLKQRCRDHGIGRWPYRKVRKLDNLIHALETGTKQRPAATIPLDISKEESKRKLDAAIETRRAILMDPNSKAHLSIGKVKGGNVGRRRQGVAALFTSRISLSLGAHMREQSDGAGSRSTSDPDREAASEGGGRELLQSRTLPNVTSPAIQQPFSESMQCPPCIDWNSSELAVRGHEEAGAENVDYENIKDVYAENSMVADVAGVGLGGFASTVKRPSAFRPLGKPPVRCTSSASTVSVAVPVVEEQVGDKEGSKDRNMSQWSGEAGPSSVRGGQQSASDHHHAHQQQQRAISLSPGCDTSKSPGRYGVQKWDGGDAGPGQKGCTQASAPTSGVLHRVPSAEGSGLTQGAGLSSEGSGIASGSACSSPAPVVPGTHATMVGLSPYSPFPIWFPPMAAFPLPGAAPTPTNTLSFAGVRSFPPWYEYPMCFQYFPGLPPAVVPPSGTDQ